MIGESGPGLSEDGFRFGLQDLIVRCTGQASGKIVPHKL